MGAISDDEDSDDDADDGAVRVKRKDGDKKKEDGDGAESGKKRKLNAIKSPDKRNKKRKLNEEDLAKLQEEMKLLVTKIFKKFPDGLQMTDLWSKIIASLSAQPHSIKKVLVPVLKEIAKKTVANGKNLYSLKDKLKG